MLSRLLCVKLKVGGDMSIEVSVHELSSERDETEREFLWTDSGEYERLETRGAVLLLANLNSCVRSEIVDGVFSRHGMLGRNDNGKSLIELCVGRELKTTNIKLKNKICQNILDNGKTILKW